MPKLEITLKQHTPLIHFQAEQDGATLRGTELKAGLDDFLRRYAGRDLKKEWYLRESEALDYRLKIRKEGQDSQVNLNELNDTPFFGNMGENRFGALLSEKVVIEVLTRYDGLKDLIKEWIQVFFYVNNFGNRKSKGFGCYTVISIEENWNALSFKDSVVRFLEKDSRRNFEPVLYVIEYKGLTLTWKKVMEQINSKYKDMKRDNRAIRGYLLFKPIQENGQWKVYVLLKKVQGSGRLNRASIKDISEIWSKGDVQK